MKLKRDFILGQKSTLDLVDGVIVMRSSWQGIPNQ